MTFESLKREAGALKKAARAQLVAYLVELNLQEDEARRRALSKKLDDTNPANWVTLEELDSRLSRLGDA